MKIAIDMYQLNHFDEHILKKNHVKYSLGKRTNQKKKKNKPYHQFHKTRHFFVTTQGKARRGQ